MCRRLCVLEKEIGELKIAVRKDEEIATLKDIIAVLKSERYTDGKFGIAEAQLCRKVDGRLLLPVDELAQTYRNEERVLTSRPHKIEAVVERPCHPCGETV